VYADLYPKPGTPAISIRLQQLLSIAIAKPSSNSNGPLIAYLKDLRGPVNHGSGPLNAARVRAFGFPDLLPGDDPRRDPETRAEALVQRLEESIEAVAESDDGYGAILHHYFFGTGNEETRQRVAAKEAKLSFNTPRNDRPKALALLAAEFRNNAGNAAGKEAQRVVTKADLVEEVVDVLERTYQGDDVKDLALMVLSDEPPIYDASVELRLRDEQGDPDAYHLTISTEKSCTHGVHFMALSPRATLADLIFSTCPRVGDVFTCSHRDHLEELADAWTHDLNTLTVLGSDASGRSTKHQVPLQLVEPDERETVLRDLPQEFHDDVVLLKADLPRSPSDPPTRLALHLSSAMSRGDGYCFWLADRPTFLNNIVFDVSAFNLREGEAFTLQPCLRATGYEPEPAEGIFTIRIERWVVRGQGALLLWG
jgi:hypothetical protein